MTSQRLTVTVLVLLVTVAAVAGLAAAHDDEHGGSGGAVTQSETVVHLDRAGDATVRARLVFDLNNEQERAGFANVMENRTYRNQLKATAVRQLSSATEGTDGTITSTGISGSQSGSLGIVVITVEMDDLATTDGDRVSLDGQFSSYALTPRVVLVPPEGYEVVSASPEPTAREGGEAVYRQPDPATSFTFTTAPSTVLPVRLPAPIAYSIVASLCLAIGAVGGYLYTRITPSDEGEVDTDTDEE